MRQLKEAQKGNREALRGLLEPHLPGLWSIVCGFVGDEDVGIGEFVEFRARLGAEVARFTVDVPFGIQLYRLLWLHLRAQVEPGGTSGIVHMVPSLGRKSRDPTGQEGKLVRQTLLAAPPLPRVIYLFGVVTGLPAPRLAEVTGEPEPRVREARAQITSLLHEALTR